MRQILLAVDDSDASRRAARFVEEFFQGDDTAVTAVNVAPGPVASVPPVPFGGVYGWPYAATNRMTDRIVQGTTEVAAQHATAEAVAAGQAPQGARVEVEFGDPVDAIVRAADDRDVDLVVVGSNDRNFLDRLFSQSVSKGVVRRAHRPVVIVP